MRIKLLRHVNSVFGMNTTFQCIIGTAIIALLSSPAFCTDSSPVRLITAAECVEAALRNNIDIAVSQADKEYEALGVPIEEAAFLPKFSGELNASQSITPSGSALDNSASVDQRSLKFQLGVTELLHAGASFSIVQENQRQETSSAYSLLSPQYVTGLTLSAKQPLLKNRGKEVTEAPLRIARAGAEEKSEEWKTKVMDIVTTVRTAFLSFVAAVREVEVRRTAVELAERVTVHTDARIRAGVAASMDLLPAESAVATRREELLRAKAAARSAEVDLKSLLGVRSSREWEERFVPVPLREDIHPPGDNENFEEAIRRRPEVAAMNARKTQAEIQEVATRNRTLPALDLTVSAGIAGLSGTPNPNPLFGGNTETFSGNYRDSVDRMISGRYYNWLVGLKTELPWSFQREKAEWARAKVALRQQILSEDAIFLRIRVEVQKGRLDLESALARIAATRAATVAAEKKLEAEERKLSVGRSTTVEVLRFQQDVSEAKLAEVRAQMDAYNAQTRLRRAVGTILEKEGIELRRSENRRTHPLK